MTGGHIIKSSSIIRKSPTTGRPGSRLNGDLYNVNTKQIIIFEPDSLELELFFRPKSGILPVEPLFEKVSAFPCRFYELRNGTGLEWFFNFVSSV